MFTRLLKSCRWLAWSIIFSAVLSAVLDACGWFSVLCSVYAHEPENSHNAARRIVFRHLGIEHGLSQNSVYAILQDRRGFMWFGTQDGLNRYDGKHLTVFRGNVYDTAALTNGYIQALYEDKSGTLWVGTHGGGLNVYNRLTNKFSASSWEIKAVQALGGTDVLCMTEDSNEVFWVGTSTGLFGVHRPSKSTRHFQAEPTNPSGLHHSVIRCLCVDNAGTLWIGTEQGLHTYTAQTGRITRCAAPMLGEAGITAITHERSDMLLISTKNGLLYRANTRSGVVTAVKTFGEQRSQRLAVISTMLADSRGNLWLGSEESGLALWNPHDAHASVEFLHSTDNPESLSSDAVLTMYEDRSGGIWIGTEGGGVSYYNPLARKFFPLRPSNSERHTAVLAIYQSQHGQTGAVWAGTLGKGLQRFDPQQRVWKSWSTADGLSSNTIWAIHEDKQGMLWLGTYGGGLNRFDPRTGRVAVWKHEPRNASSLADNYIFSICEDAQGVLWLGTNNGLCRFAPSNGTFTTFRNIAGDSTSLSMNAVRKVLADRSGAGLWIGTRGGGVNYFDVRTGKFRTYRHHPAEQQTLSNDFVLSLLQSRSGDLWVGTYSGLNRFHARTGSFTRFTRADGLPNETICSVLEDAQGNLWIATVAGLCRFHPATKQAETFTVQDGLQSNEFNQSACFQTLQGEMMFGGISGLNVFHPDSVRYSDERAPLVLTAFKKFNMPADIDTAISEKQVLHLYSDDTFIAFEFALLSYILPEKIQYAYKLDGFDKDWVQIGSRNEASYTNLAGGRYVFRVRATTFEGKLGANEIALAVIMHPPWWKLWWVQTLAVLALVGTAFGGYRWRMRAVERRNEELESLVAARTAELQAQNEKIRDQNEELLQVDNEKNEFLGIVAHDLKNPVASIVMNASMVREYFDRLSKEEIIEQMERIQEVGARMGDIITHVLDINAIESGKMNVHPTVFNLVRLTEQVVSEYRLHADKKSITLHCSAEAEYIAAFADVRSTREVLENLISNAVKYSPPGKNVWVVVQEHVQALRGSIHTGEFGHSTKHSIEHGIEHSTEERSAEALATEYRSVVSVKDEGPGLSEADKKKLFGKFARLSAQPTGGEQSTGLGLSIVKRLVEMMNGRVWCESERDAGKAGATFYVELPQQPPMHSEATNSIPSQKSTSQ